MSEMIEVIKGFTKAGSDTIARFFARGERFTSVGDKYMVREQCQTCSGVRMIDVWYWNIEIGDIRYAVKADYMTIVSPGTPQGEVFFDPQDRMNQVNAGPTKPDNYHPKAELQKFNALGVIDLRRSKQVFGRGDTGRTEKPST